MEIISQNLVVITRGSKDESNSREVLVGTKKRGKFKGLTVFPGGKAEGSNPQQIEAAREVDEEVGIELDPATLRYVGKLLLQDFRPDSRSFGNVFIYTAEVGPETEAIATVEIDPRWESLKDRDFLESMPPDVACWWPTVENFNGNPVITHVIHDEHGVLEIITKEPDFQNMPGSILYTHSPPPLA